MVVFDVSQGTEEWLRVRAGIPTASEFSTVMARGTDKSESKTRRTYMLKLAGEVITGEPAESYSNRYMERGKAMEDEARRLYSFQTNEDPQQVGFVRSGNAGCSPDSLVGVIGGLEIKTKSPHLLIDILLKDAFPTEHQAQIQGCMWITEREWWDLAIYWPALPLYVKRVYRNEVYIKRIAEAVDAFNSELADVVERVRSYGMAPAEVAA